MKTFSTTTLAVTLNALATAAPSNGQWPNHSTQAECDALLEDFGFYHLALNQEACTCMLVVTVPGTIVSCPYWYDYLEDPVPAPPTVLNPFWYTLPWSTQMACMATEDFDTIMNYEHGLGGDCIAGTADDVCPLNVRYDWDIC